MAALVEPQVLSGQTDASALPAALAHLGIQTPALGCACNADVDNNGISNAVDLACVVDCSEGNCACCTNSCDVNCDGAVTSDDTDATLCRVQGHPPATCCVSAGEACCMPFGSCQVFSEGQCAANGGTLVSHCPPDNRCVPPGQDCFTTQCGRTSFDFCNDPIPADFFGPGSLPFEGIIILGGPNDGLPDTRIQRQNAMLLDGPPETVPIQLVALSLQSCQPISVTIGTGETLWDVAVDLSPNPVPPGAMQVVKTHANGGTFEASFHVLPRFVFTNVESPSDQRVLDFGLEGRPATLFEATGTPKWVHNPSVPVPFVCGTNFVPGIEEDSDSLEQCCTETCHANPGGGHEHCTKTCSVCPHGACCTGTGACTVVDGPGNCPPGGEYKGDGTNCDDSDGDGIADWFETNDCCQPSTACSVSSNPNNPDTDGDGIFDGVEVQNGTDPCTPGVGETCCLSDGGCVSAVGTCFDTYGATATPVDHCPADGRCIPPGDDCWRTACGGTDFDFCEMPIPADFFNPGSLPFDGLLLLGGHPNPSPDTTVRRYQPMLLDLGPETIQTEIVALSLVSCQPIVVQYPSAPDEQWNVVVDLSPTAAPLGSMTVRKTHANGGTFESTLFVQPRFIFTQVGNLGNTRILDTGAEAMPPVQLDTWWPDNYPDGSTAQWAYVLYPGISHTPCGVNFVPGVQEDPDTLEQCCTEVCHANPGGGHDHCTKQCSVCPTGACCQGGTCTVVDGAGQCPPGGEYKGDGTNCDDLDGDGLPNWFENNDCCQASTACNSGSSPTSADTDGDGVSDGAEIAQGCDPCVPGDCTTPCCMPDGTCQFVIQGLPCGGHIVSHCPADGRCVPAGDDCFTTPCGRTSFDFCNDPIPADFFNPGSEPFDSIIILGSPNDGAPDTTVRRYGAMLLDGPPETIPIELVQLSLTSCSPIPVVINEVDTLWDVAVQLSPNPVPAGSMTVARTHDNGGTFTADFNVLPRFVFTQVGNPGNQRVLDFGAAGRPPTPFETTGNQPWVHDATVPAQPCGVNFVPGVEEDPGTLEQCCTETCHANPGGGHEHCTKQCNVCPTGACCLGGTCTVVDGAGNCPGEYKGDGTNCDDSDGDGIPDWLEINDCCQPSTACSIASNPNNPDTDGDGMSDGAEVAAGCDPCVADDCIPPGDDCFATSCGETAFDFCNDPIPADFFNPGSLPFEGTVYFQGASGAPNPDTFVRRMGALSLPNNGDSQTIPIELVALSLVSCSPITAGGTNWDVEVTLSPTAAPAGAMTVARTHDNGGTFRSEFYVQPLFTFREVGNPGNVRVLDTGAEGIPPAKLGGVGSSPWSRTPSVAVAPLCGAMFAPGVESDPANLTQCNSAMECCIPIGHAGPGHLHVVREVCQPCPCGACCTEPPILPGGGGPGLGECQVLESSDPAGDCAGMGGEYKGDGTTCDDTDGDGIPDWFEKSNCCELSTACEVSTDPNNPDTDGDGVNDGQELLDGTDPCAANAPPTPLPEPVPVAKNRFVGFIVPPPAAAGRGPMPVTALRVKLVVLNHPRFCCAGEDAGGFGTGCSAATCDRDANCSAGTPLCRHQLAPGTPDFSDFEGKIRYVNSYPGGVLVCPGHGAPFNESYRCATLGCEPEYRDWATDLGVDVSPAAPAGLMFVTGSALVPSSTVEVVHIDEICGGTPGSNTCPAASPPLVTGTGKWGDITSASFGDPEGKSDVLDIPAVVNYLKDIPTFFPEYRTWLKQRDPAANLDAITVIDLSDVVDGGPQERPYPASRTIDSCSHD